MEAIMAASDSRCSSSLAHRGRSSRGIASLLVVFALTVFSTVVATLLNDKELESKMRSNAPDLHLVLYSAPVEPVDRLARLNIPTTLRMSTGQRVPGAAVRVPLPSGPEFVADAWNYAVEFAPGVTVCCDGGDGSCENPALVGALPATL